MAHAHHRPWLVLVVAVAAIALLFGVWVYRNTHNHEAKMDVATVLQPSRPLEQFTLVDMNGAAFTNANLIGKWSLMFFGFTRCPDLCPTTLAILNQAYQLLEKQRLKSMPQVVFVSVDPEHDAKASVIKKYLSSFNDQFIGVTGAVKQLDQLTQNLSVLYMKVTNHNEINNTPYMIDHSGTILLINPQGKLAAIFSMPHQAFMIARDVNRLMQQKISG